MGILVQKTPVYEPQSSATNHHRFGTLFEVVYDVCYKIKNFCFFTPINLFCLREICEIDSAWCWRISFVNNKKG